MALKKSKKKENKKATKKSAKKAVKKAAKKTAGKPAKKSAPVKQRSILSASVAHKKAPASAPLAPSPRKPSVGDSVQDFAVVLTGGKKSSLSSLAGPRGLVLYFYPKDNTPGCTIEACDFRDNKAHFAKAGYGLAGVSPDSPKSHSGFTAKKALNFPLISDENKELCMAFGVWAEKSMYGRKYMGVERTTFVLSPQLKVEAVYEKVKVTGHATSVLEAVK